MKIFFLLYLIPTFLFSQSEKDFLLNDNEKILSPVKLSDVLLESKNYGYDFVRDEKQNYIFKSGGFNFVLIAKDIDNNSEGFPNFPVGTIYKQYFFLGEDIALNCPIWKIDTEIQLFEYENVSISQIKNSFNKFKNEIVKNIDSNNWVSTKNSNKINYKVRSKYFDVVEEKSMSKKSDFNDVLIIHFFLNGVRFENIPAKDGSFSKQHTMYFSFADQLYLKAEETFNELLLPPDKLSSDSYFKIGNQDLREINQYDLEAMVNFFIADCNRKNKIVQDKQSIKATFEKLEGDKIALSYGYGDDTSIIIKVDPEKWYKSSVIKRWYILYHELGHDILNFEHGQGGKMMFNFAEKEYTWEDFFIDKDYMLDAYKTKNEESVIEVIKIGAQEWTVKNLDVSRYRNGDLIPEVKDPKIWANLKTGAWCYYDNDPKNGKEYGKLYNWYAVNDPRGLAPEGYHIPSNIEWIELTTFCGGEDIGGGNMKESGITHWYGPNIGATNNIGFSGLPGGYVYELFYGIGESAYWWSASAVEDDLKVAWFRALGSEDRKVSFMAELKSFGFSVRCLKDKN